MTKIDKLHRRIAELESLLEERSCTISMLNSNLKDAIFRAEVSEKEEKSRGEIIATMRDDFDRKMTECRQKHEREISAVLLNATSERENAVLRAEERIKKGYELQTISAARQREKEEAKQKCTE